jgi:hypothetical protein
MPERAFIAAELANLKDRQRKDYIAEKATDSPIQPSASPPITQAEAAQSQGVVYHKGNGQAKYERTKHRSQLWRVKVV